MSLDPVDLKNDLDFQQTYRNLGSLQGRATVRDPESYVSRSFILSLSLSLSQRELYLWKINDYWSMLFVNWSTYNFETETLE